MIRRPGRRNWSKIALYAGLGCLTVALAGAIGLCFIWQFFDGS